MYRAFKIEVYKAKGGPVVIKEIKENMVRIADLSVKSTYLKGTHLNAGLIRALDFLASKFKLKTDTIVLLNEKPFVSCYIVITESDQ